METKKEKSSELISYISHEIKNSLNPVINLSGIMLKDKQSKLGSGQREYLEIIERNGRKILALVDYLSYINRYKNGNITRASTRASIKNIIENSVNNVSGYRSLCSIRPVCVIKTGEDEILLESGFYKKIISCVTEFFLSFHDVSSLYFRISSDINSVSMVVSETDHDDSAFVKEALTSFNCDGLSETSLLWYSLAEELISVMGGESELLHGIDGGIIWFFSLPVSAEIHYSGTESVSGENGDIRRFVLMVIDDDPDSIIPLRAIAEYEFRGSCSLVHACSGSEGIDLLGKIRPDVILLDLTLPDINGMSLVRSIRNFFTKDDVTIIAFTGHDLGLNREKLLSAGFDDIIVKPYHIDELVRKIRSRVK